MPSTFPEQMFHEFRQRAASLFPSVQHKMDSLERDQFVRSSQATGYRYRTCVECNEEFKTLLKNAPERWRQLNDDPDYAYSVERCLYTFFLNSVSVFESLVYCLYFVGSRIRAADFPDVQRPRKINLDSTGQAFTIAFPQEPITARLTSLPQNAEFKKLELARNILAHRVSGMRSMRIYSTLDRDEGSTSTTREEAWYVPGQDEMNFDGKLVQQHLDWLSSTLAALIGASRDFVTGRKP